MRALRRFTVRLALPTPLQPLSELVMNLRWSWHPASLDLFREVDPQTWEAVGHDPVRLLGDVSPERLAALAGDADFLSRLQAAHADDRHAQVAGRLEVVAGQDAEAAGVLRQH
ncbi:MAG: DUF3417 domain-containing protein, partial [Actinomycetes bacterium]